MRKAIEITIDNKKYYAYHSCEAYFAIQEKYGNANIAEKISPNTSEAFEAVCFIISVMFEQGELARRYFGHEAQTIPTEEQFKRLLQPAELPSIKQAIMKALMDSYGQEIASDDKNKVVDLGLQELRASKKKAE